MHHVDGNPEEEHPFFCIDWWSLYPPTRALPTQRPPVLNGTVITPLIVLFAESIHGGRSAGDDVCGRSGVCQVSRFNTKEDGRVEQHSSTAVETMSRGGKPGPYFPGSDMRLPDAIDRPSLSTIP